MVVGSRVISDHLQLKLELACNRQGHAGQVPDLLGVGCNIEVHGLGRGVVVDSGAATLGFHRGKRARDARIKALIENQRHDLSPWACDVKGQHAKLLVVAVGTSYLDQQELGAGVAHDVRYHFQMIEAR